MNDRNSCHACKRTVRHRMAGLALLIFTSVLPAAAGGRPEINPPAAALTPVSAGAGADAGHGVRSLAIQDAIRLALENNPELRAVRSDIDAARARQSGASLLVASNPEVNTAGGPRRVDGNDSLDWGVALSQRVEIGGQRGARMEAAEAGLRSAAARLAMRRSALIADVREAFGSILTANALARFAKDAVILGDEALAAADERYEAGDASLLEVNTARIELGRAHREALAAEQRRETGLGALRLLMGMGAHEVIAVNGELTPASLCTGSIGDLLAGAERQRGELLAARADVEEAAAEHRLAEKEAVATPAFGLAYNREADAHIVQAIVSVPLPIVQRNQAARGITSARLAKARVVVEALERRTAQEVHLAVSRCRAAGSSLNLYSREILEAAQSNADMATEGYRAGKLDFLQLLLIRRNALDARRGAIETLEELIAADANLLRVTGKEP